MAKGNNVRITDEAHALLAEKAEDYNANMKEIASEAILMLIKGKDRNKELHVLLAVANNTIQDIKHATFGSFVLGAVVAGCLGFFVGVLW